MVPLDQPMTHDEAHAYSRNVARRLAEIDRSRLTISANIHARKGRVFLDYLRNGRGTTAVGTYSPRAPGPPRLSNRGACQLEGSRERTGIEARCIYDCAPGETVMRDYSCVSQRVDELATPHANEQLRHSSHCRTAFGHSSGMVPGTKLHAA
jgi:hypothetical protein